MTSDHPSAGAAASGRPEDRAWRSGLALIVLPALAMFVFCAVNANVFADGDTNVHVAAGRWILAHGYVPATDPFSFTAVGHRWVTQEWLSEVLLALAYNGGGWSGVMLIVAAATATAFALLTAELRRNLGGLSVIVCLVFAFTVLLPHFLARPHILSLPVMILWVVQLLKARRENRTPPLWLLPLMTLWANLHADFILGLVFTSFFALEAFLGAKGRRVEVAAKWGAFLVAATLMALITPNGVTGLIYPVQVLSLKSIQSITEWRPARFDKPSSLEFAFFFTLFICLYRGVRVGAVRLGLLLLLLYMTFEHVRQEVVLGVMAPLLLAAPLGRVMEPTWTPALRAMAWPPPRQIAALGALIALLFAGVAAARLTFPEVRQNREYVPVAALAHVPSALLARPVFNDYSFGGWLMFKGVRPFMDGRSDMYGDDLTNLYMQVAAADPAAIDKAFRRYGIAWTIMQPDSALVKKLDATPGWRRLYADKWAVVQVRDSVLPPSGEPSPPPAPPRRPVG